MSSNECITVVVRCRPMNRKETEENRKGIINVDVEGRQVAIMNPENPLEVAKSFTFDATYDDNTQQRIFYEESCFSIVESTLEGFNSTIFAYGQTGCGKSFTMQGPSTSDENLRGVIPNSFSHIFQFVKSTKDIEFLIRCSYLELYNEEIRDLLGNPKNPAKCELKEDPSKGIYVKGLTDVVVESPEDLYKMLDKGLNNRTTASTLMNSESSRSHSIFTIVVEMNTKDPETGKDMLRVGKLNLVDLAGSERAKKTGAKDQTLKEGIKINLSLSVLGNVISALSDGAKHIPYRDSKLTRLLQDSLGGNTKTMMVAAISPADYNFEETMSTLRYANRAKNIKNKPKINEDPKDTMIREFKAEIERLRTLLASQANASTIMAQIVAPGQQQQQQQAPPSSVPYSMETQTPPSQYQAQIPATYSHPNSGHRTESNNNNNTADPPTTSSSNNNVQQKVNSSSPMKSSKAANKPQPDNEEEAEDYYENSFEENTSSNNNTGTLPLRSLTQNPILTPRDGGSNDDNNEVLMNNPEFEQQLRDEVANRLQQLEHMLVHHDTASTTKLSPVKEQQQQQVSAPVSPVKTASQIAAEEEEIRLYNERRQKSKRKQKEKQQLEMQRLLDDKKHMEEELEELRYANLNPANNGNNNSNAGPPSRDSPDDNSGNDKKLSRLKKKYEKKVQQAKEEMEAMREEYEYQRKSMLDNVLEQEKDLRLYEIICKSLISEKDFKKIIEKSRYDDDTDEWIIPYIKRKQNLEVSESSTISASAISNNNNNRAASNNSGGGSGGSSMLPDIFPNRQVNPVEKFDQTMKLGKGEKSRNNGGGSSGHFHVRSDGSKVPVPLLTLPGSLISASSIVSNREDDFYQNSASGPQVSYATNNSYQGFSNYSYSNHNNNDRSSARSEVGDSDVYVQQNQPSARGGAVNSGSTDNLPGIGFVDSSGGDKKKKPKNSNKVPKVPPSGGASSSSSAVPSKMPAINGNNSHQDYTLNLDQAGTGEHAGPLDDWGFSNNKAAKPAPPQQQDHYSDDDDFVTDDNAPPSSARNGGNNNNNGEKKKKKRQARNSRDTNGGIDSARGSSSSTNNSSLPPIDMKHQTPRTSSLPPI